jgi:predicted metal-dependent peptidase
MSGGAHSSRARAALVRLGAVDPGLGVLALWCRHRDAEAGDVAGDGAGGGAVAWADGETIHYAPGFEALAPHEQVGLAAHQVLHVAFRHAPRSAALAARLGEGFDAAVFNIAADALINQTLILAGHALPRPCVVLEDLLRAAFGETVAGAEAVGRTDAETLYARLMAGRGRGGTARPGEGDAPAEAAREHGRRCGFRPDLGAAEAEAGGAGEAAQAWRQRLARALAEGRAAGRGIGALGLVLADLPRARTPWEVALRRLVTRAVVYAPRPAPVRPSRRWIAAENTARARGAPVPGFEPGASREREMPRIAVCLDTSASVDDGRLARFAAEVAAIGRRTGAVVHVIVFDTEVRSHTVLRGMAWEAEIRGVAMGRGGGTDFRPALAAAAGLGPSAIVVLTDLEGPVGPAPPRVPVVWAVPGGAPVPPFGRLISLTA